MEDYDIGYETDYKDDDNIKGGTSLVSTNKIAIILIQLLAVGIVGAFDLASVGFRLSRLLELPFYLNLVSTFIASVLIFITTGYDRKTATLEKDKHTDGTVAKMFFDEYAHLQKERSDIGNDFEDFSREYNINKKRRLWKATYNRKKATANWKAKKHRWLWKKYYQRKVDKFNHLLSDEFATDEFFEYQKAKTITISETALFNEVSQSNKNNDPDAALRNDMWQMLEDLVPKALIAATTTAILGTVIIQPNILSAEGLVKLSGKVVALLNQYRLGLQYAVVLLNRDVARVQRKNRIVQLYKDWRRQKQVKEETQ